MGEFERLLLAVHYAEVRVKLREWKLEDMAYRVSLTLLRFTDLMPADLAFWEAGCGARDTGDKGAALVLLNRYIDVSEAQEEGERDTLNLEDRECRGSGFLPPGDFPMPPRPFVSHAAREEAKTWVLSTSMDRKVVATLGVRSCGGCGGQVPSCALQCPACTSELPACVVTGAPIQPQSLVECKGCGSKAGRVAWEAMVARTGICVWCGFKANREV